MAQVSQKKIPTDILKKINQQFFDSFSSQKRFKLKKFLENILTDTEEIMLAKRLAAIFMLIENESYYKIEKVLNISTSTSKRLHKNLFNNEYKDIETWYKKKKNREAFYSELEKISRLGMPPYVYVRKIKRRN